MAEEPSSSSGGANSASSQPAPEPGTISLRPVAVVTAILLLGAFGYLGYTCVHASPAGSFVAPITRFAPGSVTYLAQGRTYLVRSDDGSFLALSEVEANAADRLAGCVIRFRPDLSAGDEKGVFRDDCHGTVFNHEGIAVQGSSDPMQQHPVLAGKSDISVRLRECLAGGGNSSVEPCRE
jgi:hypothetical protein